jgi:hypothetical protein
VVAEQPEVLEDVTVIDGAIYAQLLHGRPAAVRFNPMAAPRRLPVPPMHSASIRGDGPGHAVLTLESFAAPGNRGADLPPARAPWIVLPDRATARTSRCATAPRRRRTHGGAGLS